MIEASSSIGLGGGSIVRKDSPTSKLTIGPDSVGHHIKTRAHVFGGDVPTDLARLGYGRTPPAPVPLAWVDLLRDGPELSPQAAQQIVAGPSTPGS